MRIPPAPPASDEIQAPQQAPFQAPFRVLTVCTGNLHRSPLAAGLLTARLAGDGQGYGQVFRVSSAGTGATPGEPMDPVAAALLRELGGAPSGAGSRRLTAELVAAADLVLGAATEHRDAAVRLSPVWALRRAFTLREFARLLRDDDAAGITVPVRRAAALVEGAARRRGLAAGQAGGDDVADPYGAAEEVARSAALRIAESVERISAALLGRSPRPAVTRHRTEEPGVRPTAAE